MAGNKGGCAIRLDMSSTRLCFVTAHLAAGASNFEERNRDYETISHGLRFLRNKTIDDHDTIIWFGDFNYRIDLPNQEVRELAAKNQLDILLANDQVIRSLFSQRESRADFCSAELANDGREDLPVLSRGSDHISTYLQVRRRQR